MTITIAIVMNENELLPNALGVSKIAAELKDYSRTILPSLYVMAKRRSV